MVVAKCLCKRQIEGVVQRYPLDAYSSIRFIVIETTAYKCLDCGRVQMRGGNYSKKVELHGLPVRTTTYSDGFVYKYDMPLATDYLLKGARA
jgi:hypothetical protein